MKLNVLFTQLVLTKKKLLNIFSREILQSFAQGLHSQETLHSLSQRLPFIPFQWFCNID